MCATEPTSKFINFTKVYIVCAMSCVKSLLLMCKRSAHTAPLINFNHRLHYYYYFGLNTQRAVVTVFTLSSHLVSFVPCICRKYYVNHIQNADTNTAHYRHKRAGGPGERTDECMVCGGQSRGCAKQAHKLGELAASQQHSPAAASQLARKH